MKHIKGLSFMVCITVALSFFSGCASGPVEKPELTPELLGSLTGDYTESVSDTNPENWKKANTHDPSIIHAEDGYYYSYSTDAQKGSLVVKGVHVRRSPDLVNWTFVGKALSEVPEEALAINNADYVWAPQVIYLNGRYYMYYCTSAFGKKLSYIGLAIADKPEGPFVPAGKILSCNPADPVNTIDPNVMYDNNGDLWMVYGSFFGGIYIIKLDPATGLRFEGDTGWGKKIAGGGHAAIEGPCIIQHEDYYYLFISMGDLNYDYSVRVARCPVAEGIDGTYRDYAGNDMNEVLVTPVRLLGNKILGSFAFDGEFGIRSPGGQHVYQDKDGRYYMACHTRTNFRESYYFYLQIRQLYFNKEGWPVLNPNEFAGETLYGEDGSLILKESDVAGEWQFIQTERSARKGTFKNFEKKRVKGINLADAQEAVSKYCTLTEDGKFFSPYGDGTWSLDGSDITITILTKNEETEEEEITSYYGIITPAHDMFSDKDVITITTMGTKGEYLFGNKQASTIVDMN